MTFGKFCAWSYGKRVSTLSGVSGPSSWCSVSDMVFQKQKLLLIFVLKFRAKFVATLIVSQRVYVSVCLFVSNFDAKYLGNYR